MIAPFTPEINKVLVSSPCRAIMYGIFIARLNEIPPPQLTDHYNVDINQDINNLNEVLYTVSKQTKSQEPTSDTDPHVDRWERLLKDNDHKAIWKAISWNGKLQQDISDSPDDELFKEHYDRLLLNPDAEDLNTYDTSSCPSIPVLDDPISMPELSEAITQIKPNKSCGPDGVSPGVLRLLPAAWILMIFNMILMIFNMIFISAISPIAWHTARLINIFKSGQRQACTNYRGIAISSYMFKLFDVIIHNRLTLWYRPCREQAGCQKNRGCQEQILTLRLIMDYSKTKKCKLYLLFIDFSKAYDKVPRWTLIDELKRLGCSRIMLRMITSMYSCTRLILKSAVVSANTGVLQGASSSGTLFVIYLDKMIRMIHDTCSADGFLGSLHTLLLMDDTVLLATSRQKLEEKLAIVLDYCKQNGMVINQSKTKFMVVNGTEEDMCSIKINGQLGDLEVAHTDIYTYLGSPITRDGKYSTAISLHADMCQKHLNKLIAFMDKNRDLPFKFKRAVVDACFCSTITYAGETWLGGNVKPLESLYVRAIKCLLGVRITTCTDMCLMELDYPSLDKLLLKRRSDYFKRRIPLLDDNDPLKKAIDLCRTANNKSYKNLMTALNLNTNPIEEDITSRRATLERKALLSSKRLFYLTINPDGIIHPVYTMTSNYVPEYLRIAFTRIRLVSHNLKVETGRWARIERARRLCACDRASVQDEYHVLFDCSLTQELRDTHQFRDFKELFNDTDLIRMCNFIHKVLKMV
jgi:hypothetical protein